MKVLVTNRFDHELKIKLPLIEEASFEYCADIFKDEAKLSQAEGLILRSSIKAGEELLKMAPKLKFVITATAGFDHLDLDVLKEKSVRCFHCPEAQTVAAAELTLALIFACSRKWNPAQKQIKSGDWQRSTLLGKQVQGQALGIIGYGRVGSLVAKKAKALGVKVQAYDPYLEENPDDILMLGFEEMMRTSDIVSLHVPKTKITRQMIKKETLSWLHSDALLINMSRGDVVNEADLIDYLLKNPGFRAGLDVFAKEPLAPKSRLLELPNVVLTPHVGASTEEALRDSSQMALDKALALIRGGDPEGELPPKALWWGS